MADDDSLSAYRDRRDFRVTPEPTGGRPGEEPRFVIQKHDASSLHYDFRLEAEGVLKSWAVPKGPSTDPRDKRLAIQTEDHPVDYLHFEGVIPEGEYGGGTVIVWDTGIYRNLTAENDEPVAVGKAVEQGHVAVWLEGHKVSGGYALTRTSFGGDPRKWILVKMDDSAADARRNPTSTEPESVLTGRTNEELEREEARKDLSP
ncbi:MAG: DNA polymerase ligase N-terminal domain-containing protein [Nitriliruptorales bacterium]